MLQHSERVAVSAWPDGAAPYTNGEGAGGWASSDCLLLLLLRSPTTT